MWFTAAIGTFFTTVLLHAWAARLFPARNRVAAFMLIGTPIGVALVVMAGGRFGWLSLQTIAAAATYAFLCELYLFLFTLALASISANLLVTLRAGAMTYKEIEQLYDSRSMVLTRFNRLISSGLIRLSSAGVEGEGYELTERGERLLGALNILRRIFRHD
jgi:hypothetical protein